MHNTFKSNYLILIVLKIFFIKLDFLFFLLKKMTNETQAFTPTPVATDDEKEEISVDETSLTEDEFQLINQKRSCSSSQSSLNNDLSIQSKVENTASVKNVEQLITHTYSLYL